MSLVFDKWLFILSQSLCDCFVTMPRQLPDVSYLMLQQTFMGPCIDEHVRYCPSMALYSNTC